MTDTDADTDTDTDTRVVRSAVSPHPTAQMRAPSHSQASFSDPQDLTGQSFGTIGRAYLGEAWCPYLPSDHSSALRGACGWGYEYILSPLLRLVPVTSIFTLPFRDWCPLRVYSLSPSSIGPASRSALRSAANKLSSGRAAA
eukprot:6860956-Pyramimonas_sp.AAC.1